MGKIRDNPRRGGALRLDADADFAQALYGVDRHVAPGESASGHCAAPGAVRSIKASSARDCVLNAAIVSAWR